MGDVILTMKDIDKSFPGVHALDHVNFEVRRGEVHALMGENGAGKSTLMKVLTGIYKKDSGTITTPLSCASRVLWKATSWPLYVIDPESF